MRTRCIKATLYWLVGILTGCVVLSGYYRDCNERNIILNNINSNNIVEEKQLRILGDINAEVNEPNATPSTLKYSSVSEVVQKLPLQENPAAVDNVNNDQLVKVVITTPATSSEFLDCNSIGDVLENVRRVQNSQHREQNKDGNRAVYFTSIVDPNRIRLRVAVKHATCYNTTSEAETYRYQCALREIYNLRKLRALGWKGIPDLYGACITPHKITYVVTHVPGGPLCSGNGTDRNCALARDLKNFVWGTPDPEYTTMHWLYKVTCFFKQFEEHQIFMEDFSGANFYFSHDTLDIFIVDADSIIHYGDIRLFSRSSCRDNRDCSRPSGNLWRQSALNYKIYYSCQEMEGYCYNHTCWGFDASLHNCGVGRWLIGNLRRSIPKRMYNDYMDIYRSIMTWRPQDRSSMTSACEKAEILFEKYSKSREKEPGKKNSNGA